MKTTRLLFACFLAASAFSLMRAEGAAPAATEKKAAESCCGCTVGADKKACGVDKACCCTGEPAKAGEKKEEKKDDKK